MHPSEPKTDRIPATEARLAGDKVSDLIEALSRLDPDAKVKVASVRTFNGRLYAYNGEKGGPELRYSPV